MGNLGLDGEPSTLNPLREQLLIHSVALRALRSKDRHPASKVCASSPFLSGTKGLKRTKGLKGFRDCGGLGFWGHLEPGRCFAAAVGPCHVGQQAIIRRGPVCVYFVWIRTSFDCWMVAKPMLKLQGGTEDMSEAEKAVGPAIEDSVRDWAHAVFCCLGFR